MQREILFRAQRVDNRKLVEGDLIHGVGYEKGNMFILPIKQNLAHLEGCHALNGYQVIPETIGQFTGIKIPILNGTKEDYDKDGNYKNLEYIFENDILEVVAENIRSISCYQEYQPKIGDRFVVKCFESGYMLVPINRINSNDEILFCEHKNISNYDFSNNRRSLLKIGNIYDNPELLK